MTCVIGKNSITCSRGTLKRMRAIVKDKMGNEFFIKDEPSMFKVFPDNRAVELFDGEGNSTKKVMKGFLTLVKDLSIA